MPHLPKSENPIVLRTTFQNDSAWNNICTEIISPNKEYGFLARVEFINDSSFENYTHDRILGDTNSAYVYSFIFIVDSVTLSHAEHPILCVALKNDKGKSFRVIPSQMWGVENNLSISNMDFEYFSMSVDSDGVFRGFK